TPVSRCYFTSEIDVFVWIESRTGLDLSQHGCRSGAKTDDHQGCARSLKHLIPPSASTFKLFHSCKCQLRSQPSLQQWLRPQFFLKRLLQLPTPQKCPVVSHYQTGVAVDWDC